MASYPALDLRYEPSPDTAALQDLLYAELDAFEPVAIHEHDAADGWLVFFRDGSARDAAREALLSTLRARLASVACLDVDDEDWARRSQADLTAVRAGRIVVAPPWDPAAAPPAAANTNMRNSELTDPGADIVIVIEPSMGFGTGHHATTRLCLELLQQVDVAGRRLVDVGTGSGVLAIAAWRLGAASVVALDHDPDALQSARENVARNGAGGQIEVREADLGHLALQPADVVLANLTAAVLQRFAQPLRGLAPQGALILSGFSPSELPVVAGALNAHVAREMRDGEWCAAVVHPR